MDLSTNPVQSVSLRPGFLVWQKRLERWDQAIFLLFSAFAILVVARVFYGSMHVQTQGMWSAPLDDVFIHFDYARAIARGFPFQWSEGNGVSSGNTSITYPFALAFGYLIGFRSLSLMIWAAIVACVSVLIFFYGIAHITSGAGRLAKYMAVIAVLSVGALDWTLFSGMENAFHLGVWALVIVQFHRWMFNLTQQKMFLLSILSAFLVATRPESVVCVAAIALAMLFFLTRNQRIKSSLRTVIAFGIPSIAFLGIQALFNRYFTGEWSANGAISKLAINHPYLTPQQKFDDYLFHLKYVILRNTQHHFAEHAWAGWIILAWGLLPIFYSKTRKWSLFIWFQIIGWMLLVSLNGQVRWQNERYTMPAIAWLLVLAGLGISVFLQAPWIRNKWNQRTVLLRIAMCGSYGAFFWHFQSPRMADQIWFFGRASRNIRDQHWVAGKIVRSLHPNRVLVGDAGAITYSSDIPGLDLIGLGGYHDYPFARAKVHGIGASLELVEQMSEHERPDLMAIYPTWWDEIPSYFGERIASVPVNGNVICGGAEKVIYRTDWSPFERKSVPRSLLENETIIDEVDIGNLISEKQHAYQFPKPSMGFIQYRILEDKSNSSKDLFDAGRLIPKHQIESMKVRSACNGRIIFRTATTKSLEVSVRKNAKEIGIVSIEPGQHWVEASLNTHSDSTFPCDDSSDVTLTLSPTHSDWTNYHVWVTQYRK